MSAVDEFVFVGFVPRSILFFRSSILLELEILEEAKSNLFADSTVFMYSTFFSPTLEKTEGPLTKRRFGELASFLLYTSLPWS